MGDLFGGRKKAFYRMPAEPQRVADAVRSVPDDWEVVHGILYATADLYAQGKVAMDTRCEIRNLGCATTNVFDRSYEDVVKNVGRSREYHPADHHGVTFGGKRYSSFSFLKARAPKSGNIGNLRRLVVDAILAGYKGAIGFYMDRDFGPLPNVVHTYHSSACLFASHPEDTLGLSWDSDNLRAERAMELIVKRFDEELKLERKTV